MKIDCISDLHGYYPPLEGVDVLILAGDYTASNRLVQWVEFFSWLKEQEYRKKILIGGNHDGFFEIGSSRNQREASEVEELQRLLKEQDEMNALDFEYLCDSGTTFEGLNFWGSPYTPTFCNWNFMKERGPEIRAHWDLIPQNTHVLITHGPPLGILDKVQYSSKALREGHAGCADLREAVERIQPRLHVFGHVHEGYGEMILKCTPKDVRCVNAAIMNAFYHPANQPIRIVL